LDLVGKAANMLDNLRMKPSDKISTYNVDFICYASQLGWRNSVLCLYCGIGDNKLDSCPKKQTMVFPKGCGASATADTLAAASKKLLEK